MGASGGSNCSGDPGLTRPERRTRRARSNMQMVAVSLAVADLLDRTKWNTPVVPPPDTPAGHVRGIAAGYTTRWIPSFLPSTCIAITHSSDCEYSNSGDSGKT